MMLSEFDALLGREGGQVSHEPRGLQRTVAGMEDRAAKVGAQVRDLVPPFGRKAVLAQRLVLRADLDALFATS